MTNKSASPLNGVFILLLVCALLLGSVAPAFAAYRPAYTDDAVRLNQLGLLRGTGNGFELEKSMTRLEGAALFIRLMGEENTALSTNKSHPFSDVSGWASAYVGQMFAQGYSNGISNTAYGTGAMTADQFAAYVLRALGYREADGDFVWSQALSAMKELDIITVQDYSRISSGSFIRDYAVRLSSAALDATLKDKSQTLYQKLQEQGALRDPGSNQQAATQAVWTLPGPVADGTSIRSYDDMTRIFQQMRINLQDAVTLNTSGITLTEMKSWLDRIVRNASADVWGWSLVSTYTSDSNRPSKITVKWRYSDGYEVAHAFLYPGINRGLSARNQQIQQVAQTVLDQYIHPGMTDRQKIKAIHDYLVRTVQYDVSFASDALSGTDNIPDAFMVYGALVNKKAVCDGYSKAFDMFMAILGIPCDRVVGLSTQSGSVDHAWNRVYLDGQWLHIDVTWDDPVPDQGQNVQYTYFLLTEQQMSADHTWDKAQFIPRYQ